MLDVKIGLFANLAWYLDDMISAEFDFFLFLRFPRGEPWVVPAQHIELGKTRNGENKRQRRLILGEEMFKCE